MPAPERKNGHQLLNEKADKKAAIEVPDATDLPSAITLLNAIKAKINDMNAPVVP